jgi:hypothetical protein
MLGDADAPPHDVSGPPICCTVVTTRSDFRHFVQLKGALRGHKFIHDDKAVEMVEELLDARPET